MVTFTLDSHTQYVKHTMIKLGNGFYILDLDSNSGIVRVGSNITNPTFKMGGVSEYNWLDPSGGPMITVGREIKTKSKPIVVKNILSIQGQKYFIILTDSFKIKEDKEKTISQIINKIKDFKNNG